MDVQHFGLSQLPFRSSPDPSLFVSTAIAEETLRQIESALSDGEGFAVVTGEPGIGKTMLATVLLQRMDGEQSCVFLTNSHFSQRSDLYQSILFDLGRPFVGLSEQELRLSVTDVILGSFAEKKSTLLVIDEAHHLSVDLLEELRLLSNLETRYGKAVNIVLFGLPSLLDKLKQEELVALSQRISCRCDLARLDAAESREYLDAQCRKAGAAKPSSLLSDEAAELVIGAAGGLPRLLNQVMYLSLSLAEQAGEKQVDAEAAIEAVSRLGLSMSDEDAEPRIEGVQPKFDTELEDEAEGREQPRVVPRLVFGSRND